MCVKVACFGEDGVLVHATCCDDAVNEMFAAMLCVTVMCLITEGGEFADAAQGITVPEPFGL